MNFTPNHVEKYILKMILDRNIEGLVKLTLSVSEIKKINRWSIKNGLTDKNGNVL